MEVSGRTQSNSKYGKGDIFCQPCQSDDDNVEADGFCETCNEYFCSSCLKVHRKQSMSKYHVIKAKDEMPRVRVQTDPCSDMCEVHKTEVVKYFCKGHNSVGCGDCMVLEHTSCKIQLISDISENYDNSDDLKEINDKIEELQMIIKASKFEIKKSLKAAEEVRTSVIEEIKTFRREMDTYLDKVENDLIKDIANMYANDVSQQRQLFNEYITIEDDLHEFQRKLDLYSININQLFITAKQAETKLFSCQQRVEKIASESQIHVYKFDPCKDMNTLELNSTPIGRITPQIQKFHFKTMKDIAETKTDYVKKINVKGSNESEDCCISGLAIISSDEILLADCSNNSLKIINVRSNTITSSLELSNEPWDVTMINSETVATTLPFLAKVMFVSTRNGLCEGESLKVRQWCYGIDHRNGVIAVSFTSPPAVQILNMKGDILHEVKDTRILKYPSYVAFKDGNNIVVSDCDNHAVYELTIDGHFKATMKDRELISPRGLAVTSSGTVVVCCEGNSDSLGMIVPETREVISINLQHVKNPYTILLREEEKTTMYICEWRNTEDDNFIHVYHLEQQK